MKLSSQNYKRFLDPSVISNLKSIELKAKFVVEGFMVGLHKSPYHGFSVEFSEHRAYNQGDPIRSIDWKVYGKSERYYVKQYEEETNLICNVILDISKSMDYKQQGVISKLEYGKILAAGLIYLLLQQQDSVGLSLYSDKIESYVPPRSTRIYLRKLLKVLAGAKAANTTKTAQCLNSVAEKIKKRGMVIIISDFFDDPDEVISAIKHFHFKKNEVIVFQILDPVERNFKFGQDAVFIDKETGEEMTTQPYQIQKAYQEAMHEFTEKIKGECLSFGVEYNLLDTTTPFDKAFYSYFKKRSMLN